ncbi:MAG: hypothetical protein WC454_10650 [Phycisphaerae bacterium]|jgi:hypothetical protein
MIKFTLYDLPASLNDWQNLHRLEKARRSKQIQHDVYYASFNQRPKEPFKKAHVKITIFFLTNRQRDVLNYPCKPEIDGLVKAKIIKDDNTEIIGKPEINPDYDPVNPRTEYEITEIKTQTKEGVKL